MGRGLRRGGEAREEPSNTVFGLQSSRESCSSAWDKNGPDSSLLRVAKRAFPQLASVGAECIKYY